MGKAGAWQEVCVGYYFSGSRQGGSSLEATQRFGAPTLTQPFCTLRKHRNTAQHRVVYLCIPVMYFCVGKFILLRKAILTELNIIHTSPKIHLKKTPWKTAATTLIFKSWINYKYSANKLKFPLSVKTTDWKEVPNWPLVMGFFWLDLHVKYIFSKDGFYHFK